MTITFIVPRACAQCHDRRAENKGDKLFCMNCGAERGRFSGRSARFVEAVVKQFGPLDSPVQLRHQQKEDGAA